MESGILGWLSSSECITGVKFNSSGRIQVNGNEIIISIKSEPKHGKANREMIKKMSNFFGVPENSIYIISGQTSRKKVIEIQNA